MPGLVNEVGWGEEHRRKCIMERNKLFRFGDEAAYPPTGSVLLNATMTDIPPPPHARFHFLIEVGIATSIPTLVSRRATIRTKDQIDFQTNVVEVPGIYSFQSAVSPTGHLVLLLHPARFRLFAHPICRDLCRPRGAHHH